MIKPHTLHEVQRPDLASHNGNNYLSFFSLLINFNPFWLPNTLESNSFSAGPLQLWGRAFSAEPSDWHLLFIYLVNVSLFGG